MREIKFRAWDKWQIEVYGTGMSYGENEYFDDMLAFRFRHFESDNPDDIVYEQFTGLLDKNGKEIYEGDVLGYRTGSGHLCSGVMKWVEDESRWAQFIPITDFEVIGNIHENPELLK
jgi:uncharacterized phage protein (TIGR01671 family)